MVTSHQMTLSGLAAGTTYYYQVNSTDSKGNHGHGGNKFNTGGFSLSGTINPTAAGNGAAVALSGGASASATADSSGNYTFAGLANGSCMVTPKRTGYTFTPGNQSATVSGANVTGVNFTANATPVAPAITTQPASQTVTAGQTAPFSVAATGTAPLSYQWQKNSVPVTGATSPSYTTAATTSSDNAVQFAVVVSNTAGSATSIGAILTVNAVPVAPCITTQPASQTVTTGQTASFSVAATGTAPLTYQRQKNGVAISVATSSSYTTAATISSDNGALFTVLVSNTAGSVTGNAAALMVNAAPLAPSIQNQKPDWCPGGDACDPTSNTLPTNWQGRCAWVAATSAVLWTNSGINELGTKTWLERIQHLAYAILAHFLLLFLQRFRNRFRRPKKTGRKSAKPRVKQRANKKRVDSQHRPNIGKCISEEGNWKRKIRKQELETRSQKAEKRKSPPAKG